MDGGVLAVQTDCQSDEPSLSKSFAAARVISGVADGVMATRASPSVRHG
jgi:hypothetical protein